MIGAIIGDTVGSRFEFNNCRSKDFALFGEHSRPTDDSIMTFAVCECLVNGYVNDEDDERIIDTFKKWGRAYPDAGYGGNFGRWLRSDDRKPYGSYGNGAAMRISPVGWFAKNEEEVKRYARRVTAITHNHPEALKAAEVVAMCIYYARRSMPKEAIKDYVERYYDLDFDYEDLKKNYRFNETCQESVPQAIYCFLISKSFEDCLRTTISIGGDCDTTAAISCAIAEAYYDYIPYDIYKETYNRLPAVKDGCDPYKLIASFIKEKFSPEPMLLLGGLFLSVTDTRTGKVIEEYKKFGASSEISFAKRALYDHILPAVMLEDDDVQQEALKQWDLEAFFNAYTIDQVDEEMQKDMEKMKAEVLSVLNKKGMILKKMEKVIKIASKYSYLSFKIERWEIKRWMHRKK